MLLILSFLTILSIVYSQGPTGLNVVVDVSHWQSLINFNEVRSDGVLGVIHKATQGLGYVDPDYESRKVQALSSGLLWGAYHFANGSDGAKQAQHYLQVVGNDPSTILALDVEENPTGASVTLEIAEAFVEYVVQTTKRLPLVYGSAFLRNLVKGNDSILLRCPLWTAQWGPDKPSNVAPWKDWTLWQYTDGKVGVEPHSVNGIGNCDRDTINSDKYQSIKDMWAKSGIMSSE